MHASTTGGISTRKKWICNSVRMFEIDVTEYHRFVAALNIWIFLVSDGACFEPPSPAQAINALKPIKSVLICYEY